MTVSLRMGYVPLTDALPLIVAHELGFAAEEGLALEPVRQSSWAQSRDALGAGLVDAAHMLVPMPVAQAIGLGPALPRLDLLMVISQGGQAIAVSLALAEAMRAAGHPFDMTDAHAAGRALLAASGGRLRVAVPFPFSTQAELVWHWLGGTGFDVNSPDVQVVTVPPPQMTAAMEAGEVDAYCVGEPWASTAVERGVGALLLPGRAIWASPPEKGLVMRHETVETQPELTGRLMRALWRAGRWLDQRENRGTAAELLARPEWLDLPSEITERGLIGKLMISPAGELREVPRFVTFHDGAATFPWKSLGALYASRLAQRHGLDPGPAMQAAMEVFRTDLYRQHLRAAGADLPGASSKLEGALSHAHAVSSEKGRMILPADAFFDGHIFDPPFTPR